MTPKRIEELRKQANCQDADLVEDSDAIHECLNEIEELQKQLMTPLERGLRRALLEGSCSQSTCRAERFRTKTGTVCANGHVDG